MHNLLVHTSHRLWSSKRKIMHFYVQFQLVHHLYRYLRYLYGLRNVRPRGVSKLGVLRRPLTPAATGSPLLLRAGMSDASHISNPSLWLCQRLAVRQIQRFCGDAEDGACKPSVVGVQRPHRLLWKLHQIVGGRAVGVDLAMVATMAQGLFHYIMATLPIIPFLMN